MKVPLQLAACCLLAVPPVFAQEPTPKDRLVAAFVISYCLREHGLVSHEMSSRIFGDALAEHLTLAQLKNISTHPDFNGKVNKFLESVGGCRKAIDTVRPILKGKYGGTLRLE